uniref:CD6 molecule n=1 Tax=Spermophilus dauricus TaxID=99837 RepID=A0A8C9UTI6_SPEDA
MLEHGKWGTVCDDTWDLKDAQVVCQQLKCGQAIQALPGLHFTPGKGPIHRDQVNCSGTEAYLWDCPGLPGDQYCGHKEDAGAVCSGQWVLSGHITEGRSSVTVKVENWGSRELTLLVPCILLAVLLLVSLICMAVVLLRVKGKYGRWLAAGWPCSVLSPVPKLPIQVRVPPPEDSNSSSDSDYEHYDFSSQPPVALTTFYNSQRHRVTEEEAQQSRFQMPPLEEGAEELHVSHVPAAIPGHLIADRPSLVPQFHPRINSGSSTSSGEDYCNSPSTKPPPWNPQGFSSERSPFQEQPPNLELAGSQATFAGPSADDSSSTSSGGDWYQNFQPPPQLPSMEQLECPGTHNPHRDSTDQEDYDDIGAA